MFVQFWGIINFNMLMFHSDMRSGNNFKICNNLKTFSMCTVKSNKLRIQKSKYCPSWEKAWKYSDITNLYIFRFPISHTENCYWICFMGRKSQIFSINTFSNHNNFCTFSKNILVKNFNLKPKIDKEITPLMSNDRFRPSTCFII